MNIYWLRLKFFKINLKIQNIFRHFNIERQVIPIIYNSLRQKRLSYFTYFSGNTIINFTDDIMSRSTELKNILTIFNFSCHKFKYEISSLYTPIFRLRRIVVYNVYQAWLGSRIFFESYSF